MNNKYTPPEGTSPDTQVYHVFNFDTNADLPLNVSNHDESITAIIPTFKNILTQAMPNYFKIFDKTKNSESTFRETNHQAGEIFALKIPNLVEPRNVAGFIKILLNQDESEIKIIYDDANLLDYFWIAMYFQVESMIEFLVKHALHKENFKLLGLLAFHDQIDEKYDDKIKELCQKPDDNQHNKKSLQDLWSSFEKSNAIMIFKFVEKYGSIFGLELNVTFKNILMPISDKLKATEFDRNYNSGNEYWPQLDPKLFDWDAETSSKVTQSLLFEELNTVVSVNPSVGNSSYSFRPVISSNS